MKLNFLYNITLTLKGFESPILVVEPCFFPFRGSTPVYSLCISKSVLPGTRIRWFQVCPIWPNIATVVS
jgi:hypothetical protein